MLYRNEDSWQSTVWAFSSYELALRAQPAKTTELEKSLKMKLYQKNLNFRIGLTEGAFSWLNVRPCW